MLTRILCGARALAKRAHQADDAVLGRRVAQAAALQSAETPQSGGRAGEDDRTALSPGDQVRYRGLGGVECADEIHREDIGPLLEILVVGQLAERHRRDARVGQHDVQPAELLHPGIERRLQRVIVADVGDRRDHLAALGFHQCDGLVELFSRRHRVAVGRDVGADVHADDRGAVGGEPHSMAAPLSAGHTGDEGDLAVQRAHRSSLRCVSNCVTPGTVTWLLMDGKGGCSSD